MKPGEVIGNRATGETITMLISEEDNGGVRQLYRVLLPSERPCPPLHYHVGFTETFTAIEGSLDMYLGRERRHVRLQAGESITVELYQLHSFGNHSNQPHTMTVETLPAGGVLKAFQLAYGVANAGGAADDGLPRNRFIRMRFVSLTEGFLPRLPLRLQRFVMRAVALASRLTGVERRVNQYIAASKY